MQFLCEGQDVNSSFLFHIFQYWVDFPITFIDIQGLKKFAWGKWAINRFKHTWCVSIQGRFFFSKIFTFSSGNLPCLFWVILTWTQYTVKTFVSVMKNTLDYVHLYISNPEMKNSFSSMSSGSFGRKQHPETTVTVLRSHLINFKRNFLSLFSK